MEPKTKLFILSLRDVRKVMSESRDFYQKAINLVGQRLRKTERKLESLVFKDARTRIIEFIKDSVNQRGRKIGYEMLLKHSLTHQDIANITCTSRQTVTTILNQFREEGLLDFDRKRITIKKLHLYQPTQSTRRRLIGRNRLFIHRKSCTRRCSGIWMDHWTTVRRADFMWSTTHTTARSW